MVYNGKLVLQRRTQARCNVCWAKVWPAMHVPAKTPAHFLQALIDAWVDESRLDLFPLKKQPSAAQLPLIPADGNHAHI